MAQVGLLSNQQNYNSLYKNVEGVRTSKLNQKIASNTLKGDNFQCTYLRRQLSQDPLKNGNSVNVKQITPGCSDDIKESESDSSSYVLRWLKSLPSSFLVDELEENMDCSFEKPPDYRCALVKSRDKKSKSLGSSLQSMDKVPLEGKRKMLLGRNQRVGFVDELDSPGMSCPLKRNKEGKRICPNPPVSRLAKKYGKPDLRPTDTRSQQTFMNYNQWRQMGVSKNASSKSIISAQQSQTMERKIENNRRLLSSIKEIISTVDGDDRSCRIEMVNKTRKLKYGRRYEKVGPPTGGGGVNTAEQSIRKPIFKNPEVERSLNNSMKSTLKRYIHSSTWDDFKENKNIKEEPPVKKGKRVLPSLAPSDSVDIEPDWNAHPVFSTLRTF